MSVSLRGCSAAATGATNISLRLAASDDENAAVLPSGVRLNPDPIQRSDAAYLVIARVAGSMLNRNADVRCEAVKKRPAGVQRTIPGFSSNAVLMLWIRPPAAGITAIALFA